MNLVPLLPADGHDSMRLRYVTRKRRPKCPPQVILSLDAGLVRALKPHVIHWLRLDGDLQCGRARLTPVSDKVAGARGLCVHPVRGEGSWANTRTGGLALAFPEVSALTELRGVEVTPEGLLFDLPLAVTRKVVELGPVAGSAPVAAPEGPPAAAGAAVEPEPEPMPEPAPMASSARPLGSLDDVAEAVAEELGLPVSVLIVPPSFPEPVRVVDPGPRKALRRVPEPAPAAKLVAPPNAGVWGKSTLVKPEPGEWRESLHVDRAHFVVMGAALCGVKLPEDARWGEHWAGLKKGHKRCAICLANAGE